MMDVLLNQYIDQQNGYRADCVKKPFNLAHAETDPIVFAFTIVTLCHYGELLP